MVIIDYKHKTTQFNSIISFLTTSLCSYYEKFRTLAKQHTIKTEHIIDDRKII